MRQADEDEIPGGVSPAVSFSELLSVMEKLRGPNGCPWDREQTHESIRIFLLEEAYETLEAIQQKKWESLKEELGDLLFQVVFHARMAEESGLFNMRDVIAGLIRKLISRHPHVFGEASVKDAKEQTLHWDKLKSKEKPESLLERVPKTMPGLLQAFELQERAHRQGFKWNRISGVRKKLKEELNELSRAQKGGNKKEIEEELGDVLFMLANLGRWLGLNAEEALLKTNGKFRERFAYLESKTGKMKRQISDLSPSELEKIWREAKRKKRSRHDRSDKTDARILRGNDRGGSAKRRQPARHHVRRKGGAVG